jgi:hypothetical protein
MLNRAFHLAHYVYSDREVAVQIAAAALADVEASVAAQDKRLYYTPSGRGARNGKSRTKISLSESHLLQRLVYAESEPYEVQQERAAGAPSLSEQMMIIRFIKHLVKITLKRNSFYVTLGVNRLLFNYTTAETAGIYGVVAQDPDRTPDDDYCRKCKKRLMAELKERFGKLLEVCRRQRGEERFVTRQDSSGYIQLVRDALKRFTPWDTSCPVPADFDARASEIARLAYYGEDPDGEHRVEIDRVHAVLHPDCHDRLLAGLRLVPADSRLAVPEFALTRSDDSPAPGAGDPPSNLSEDELKAIRDELDKQSERRKKAHTGWLRILVDGQQRATLRPGRPGPVRFEVEESDELIKVVTDDERGSVLMATCLISQDIFRAGSDPSRLAIVLEGSQEISFVLSPSRNDEEDVQRASVEVAWKERSWFWRIWAWLMWLRPDAVPAPSRSRFGMKSLATGAAAAAILIAVTASLVYFQFTGRETGEDLAKREEGGALTVAPATAPSPSGSLAANPGSDPAQRSEPKLPSREEGADQMFQEPNLRAGRVRSESGIKTLLEVKRIAVIVESDDIYQQPMQEALTHSLQAQDRINVAANPKEANAALKVTVEKKADSESLIYVARLVNVTGDRLWPKPGEEPGLKYEGAMNEVAEKIVKDLTNEIINQEKQNR